MEGCNLAEARERTAERLASRRRTELAAQLQAAPAADGAPGWIELERIEAEISALCQGHFRAGRLVAFGCRAPSDKLHPIRPGDWAAPTMVDWTESSIQDVSGGVLRNVRVHPILLAPNRTWLLDGLPLIDVFRQFVLGDAEVAPLGREAIRLSPKFTAIFLEGRCFVYGVAQLPFAFERWSMKCTVHPDPEKQSIFDRSDETDPIEAVVAAEARLHRWRSLITLLRSGELEVRAAPGISGAVEVIPRAIWSHEDFHFEPSTGDILQTNPHSKDQYDHYIKRWVGAVLRRPTQQSDQTEPPHHTPSEVEEVFHGKPPTHRGARLSTLDPPNRASRKGVARVEASIKDVGECRYWLIELMTDNPNRRISIEALWKDAHVKWPGLSKNSFLKARADAIAASGAAAWAAGGAPKKSSNQ